MFTLAGKAALIYGAAQGIGRAVALEFARRGATVGVADINMTAAEHTAAAIAAAGGHATAITCDVTREQSVREAACEAESRLGRIDVVMNNVGAILSGNPEDIPIAEWRRIMDLNFFGTVHSNQYHTRMGMKNGLSRAELEEVLYTAFPYAGFPAAQVAKKAMLEAFAGMQTAPDGA